MPAAREKEKVSGPGYLLLAFNGGEKNFGEGRSRKAFWRGYQLS